MSVSKEILMTGVSPIKDNAGNEIRSFEDAIKADENGGILPEEPDKCVCGNETFKVYDTYKSCLKCGKNTPLFE